MSTTETLPPGATFVERSGNAELWETRYSWLLVVVVGRYNDRDGGRRVLTVARKEST